MKWLKSPELLSRKEMEEKMKSAFLSVLLAVVLLIPCVSRAESTGIYFAPKFLMTIQDTGTVERSGSFAGSGLDDYSQFTLGGGLAVGYDFWPQQMVPLRLEIEFALRGNSEKTWSDGGFNVSNVKGVWNNSTLFANLFWDFHNSTPFTPYVGAGVGLAFNYTGYDITRADGEKFSMDERFTNFAWNAGAGAAYSFNDNFAIDASYRFVGLGYNEVSSHHLGQKYEIGSDPYNNEFMLGLRFSF